MNDQAMTASTMAHDVGHAPPPSFVAFTRLRTDRDVDVVLRGDLDAATAPVIAAILDSATRMGAGRILIDLAGVTDWSLLVEAMILSTFRRLDAEGSSLVLRSPSERLRSIGSRLHLFSRIPTER